MAEKIPRLVANLDVRKFKLDPTDGFLMTRIDGRLTARELARETGLPEFQVEKTLEKLEKLGVVERYDPSAPVTPVLPPPPARDRTKLPEFASISGEAKYDPKELEEENDLSADQKKRILDIYYRLEDMDHYTLLGIGKDADKKTVKRSYFELASVMHPDRYFKKKLGSFKSKMEQLFGRVTEAHDTLTDAGRRLDYDAYLDEVATTKGMEAMLERAVEESRRTSTNEASARDSSPGPLASTRPGSAPVPEGARTPSPSDIQARREALAKRLLGGASMRPPAASTPSSRPTTNPLRYSNSGDAVDALKRRYEDRIDSATSNQARKYLKAAEDAISKNDIVAAASSLHIATKFAPDDVELAMRYQEIRNSADQLLCDSYAKQALYEERGHHWAEAAKNWQKAAKILVTDAKFHERAAYCLFMSPSGDLHQAAEHAKVAVAAAPSVIAHHVTMAEIYLKAGKLASAKRAAETGLGLDPKNVVLIGIVKQATKT